MRYNVMDTLQCRYNKVNFLQNPHIRHPIASLWGQDTGIGSLLGVLTLIYILTAVLYEISCDIRWHYNGPQLYLFFYNLYIPLLPYIAIEIL